MPNMEIEQGLGKRQREGVIALTVAVRVGKDWREAH